MFVLAAAGSTLASLPATVRHLPSSATSAGRLAHGLSLALCLGSTRRHSLRLRLGWSCYVARRHLGLDDLGRCLPGVSGYTRSCVKRVVRRSRRDPSDLSSDLEDSSERGHNPLSQNYTEVRGRLVRDLCFRWRASAFLTRALSA